MVSADISWAASVVTAAEAASPTSEDSPSSPISAASDLSWRDDDASDDDATPEKAKNNNSPPKAAAAAAKYVRGNVTMECSGGGSAGDKVSTSSKMKRVLANIRSSKSGILVFHLNDGGSLSFYLDTPKRQQLSSTLPTLSLSGRKRTYKKKESIIQTLNSSEHHNNSKHASSSVYAGTRDFVDPFANPRISKLMGSDESSVERPVLRIPGEVPWKFQVVSRSSFQITGELIRALILLDVCCVSVHLQKCCCSHHPLIAFFCSEQL